MLILFGNSMKMNPVFHDYFYRNKSKQQESVVNSHRKVKDNAAT